MRRTSRCVRHHRSPDARRTAGTRCWALFGARTVCLKTFASSWCANANSIWPTPQILRVAAVNSAYFEWIQHAPVGIKGGLTDRQLGCIRDLASPLPSQASPEPLNAFQAAALAYADAMTRDVYVPDQVLSDLKSHLQNDQQLLECTATTACYNMVSRFLVALDVGDHMLDTVPIPEAPAEEQEVQITEGVALHARVHKRKEDGDSAPWIVCINSLMTTLAMWDQVVPTLARRYNVVLYDQRGHGKSSVPPEACTLGALADDVPALLKGLGISAPVHAVIGVSQGGATALRLAQRHTAIASHFVVCDTQPTSPAANAKAWDERIELAHKNGMTTLADVTTPRWFAAGTLCAPGGPRHRWIHSQIAQTDVTGFERSARALQGYDVAPGMAAAFKDKHVLFVAGSNDGKLPGVLEKAAQSLEGKTASVAFKSIPGGGHLPMCDQPSAFLQALLPFLSS